MADADKVIGRNLAALRGNRSQQVIADEMRKRGWKWSQATVWSVEKGERPLRLTEAADLAQVLGIASSDLLQNTPERELREALHRATIARNRLTEAVETFLQSQLSLEQTVDRLADDPQVGSAILDECREQLGLTLDEAVRIAAGVGPWAKREVDD